MPQVSSVVPLRLGEVGGAGLSAAVTLALTFGAVAARFALALSVTYGFDTQETTPSVTLGLVTSF